jgi:hypothetical protein
MVTERKCQVGQGGIQVLEASIRSERSTDSVRFSIVNSTSRPTYVASSIIILEY